MFCVLSFFMVMSERQLDLPHIENTKQRGYIEGLGSRNGCFSPYIRLKQVWQWAVISAMHQIAQWRGHSQLSDDKKVSMLEGSPLARVPKARERADAIWEGVFKHTSCPFRLRHLSFTRRRHRESPNATLSHHYCGMTNLLPFKPKQYDCLKSLLK